VPFRTLPLQPKHSSGAVASSRTREERAGREDESRGRNGGKEKGKRGEERGKTSGMSLKKENWNAAEEKVGG
jgi:hypothetical protein